jgi:hypothetical protein
MELQKITPGKRLAYANHKTEGVFTVKSVDAHPSNGVTWVTGFDKAKNKDIKVFPSQVSAIKRS